jgi:hypothetical protein
MAYKFNNKFYQHGNCHVGQILANRPPLFIYCSKSNVYSFNNFQVPTTTAEFATAINSIKIKHSTDFYGLSSTFMKHIGEPRICQSHT